MKVRCTRGFRDIVAGVFRNIGDEFEVDERRYAEINGAGYGQLVEPVPEAKRRTKAEKPVEPEPERAMEEGEGELAAETTPRPSRRRARAQE